MSVRTIDLDILLKTALLCIEKLPSVPREVCDCRVSALNVRFFAPLNQPHLFFRHPTGTRSRFDCFYLVDTITTAILDTIIICSIVFV